MTEMESALEPSTKAGERPPGLDAATMCEAFQLTAASARRSGGASARADGAHELTFADYADASGGLPPGWRRSASARATRSR